jgi:hypothetical protein
MALLVGSHVSSSSAFTQFVEHADVFERYTTSVCIPTGMTDIKGISFHFIRLSLPCKEAGYF